MKTSAYRNLGRVACAVMAAVAMLLSISANASTVVFQDDFEDGVADGWNLTSNFAGVSGLATSTAYPAANVGKYALEVYFDLQQPGSYTNLFASASRTFYAPVSGSYSLTANVLSADCSGCVESAVFKIDNVILGSAVTRGSFSFINLTFANLGAGNHTLSLLTTANVSYFGKFYSAFDNIQISTTSPVPEPSAGLLFLAGAAGLAVRQRRLLAKATATTV